MSCNQSFINHICHFVGQTVTIFTTSGGASGCGFSGVILSVNCEFVRLATQQGTPPSNPLSENICGNNECGSGCMEGDYIGSAGGRNGDRNHGHVNMVGSVCDIPINRIAAFCHNAV